MSAAMNGQLEVLKWLRKENDPPCPWMEDTCTVAATSGRLEVLEWLRKENDPPCPWDRVKCGWEASVNGHDHVLDWLFRKEP